MNGRAMLFGVAVMVALWQARQEWMLRPVHPRDGPLAPGEPLQSEMDPPVTVRQSRWELTERAHYDVTARILSREDYRFDALADLIPEDLALGWGPMSDNQVLRHFEIKQAARFYSWRPLGPLPLPAQVVTEHSANTHVIPADAQVRAELRQLRVGQVVRLTGVLVDGRRDDGARARTSLTRSDSGAGACEIMLVEQVEVR